MQKICILTVLVLSLQVLSAGAKDFEFVSFIDYYGGIEPTDGYRNLRSRVFMRPSFSGFEDNTGLEWILSANLWAQPLGDHEGINPYDILHEAYLLRPFDYFDITLGQKIVRYGFADVFGPLDALHSTNRAPYSLDEGFDSWRADPMIQIRVYPTIEDTVELTYVPITRPDKGRRGDVILPDSSDTVRWNDDPYITDNLHSLFLDYRHYGEKWDLELFYAWYTEHSPDFLIPETSKAKKSIIMPIYRKKHTFGFAYATRIWDATLSQDFAFNLSSDFEGTDIGAQNSDITVNTQLLVNLPWDILSQYSLIYSFFPNHGQHKKGDEDDTTSYLAREIQGFHTQPLQHIAFVIAHLERGFLREKLKASLNVGFFFSAEMYFAPRLSYSINDYWQVAAGCDIILGDPPDNDLRQNNSNDNYYVRLLYRY